MTNCKIKLISIIRIKAVKVNFFNFKLFYFILDIISISLIT